VARPAHGRARDVSNGVFGCGTSRLEDARRDDRRWFEVVVDARSGKVLSRSSYAAYAPEGNIYTVAHPDLGSQHIVSFAGAAFDNAGWIAGTTTAGNNANAYEDLNNDDVADYQRQTPPFGDPAYQHYDYTFTNALATSGGTDITTDRNAAVTQAFYWINFLHDYYYTLGFDEASGNFQYKKTAGALADIARGVGVAANERLLRVEEDVRSVTRNTPEESFDCPIAVDLTCRDKRAVAVVYVLGGVGVGHHELLLGLEPDPRSVARHASEGGGEGAAVAVDLRGRVVLRTAVACSGGSHWRSRRDCQQREDDDPSPIPHSHLQ
jgi:Fungalysin metallopeptidase (M36)